MTFVSQVAQRESATVGRIQQTAGVVSTARGHEGPVRNAGLSLAVQPHRLAEGERTDTAAGGGGHPATQRFGNGRVKCRRVTGSTGTPRLGFMAWQ